MKHRTWPVFFIGLGTLLLLIFLPGLAALRQSAQMYDEIRAMQHAHEQTQQSLFGVQRRILLASILVRDFLLDTSPETAPTYREQFQLLRNELGSDVNVLAGRLPQYEAAGLDRLRTQLDAYWRTVEPVFGWTPPERLARGTYFLRQQQRPRRESILAITNEIGRLLGENYSRRYEDLNASQRAHRHQLRAAIAVAFLVGLLVAAASIVRIAALERRARQHRLATEQAEREMRSLSARLMEAQEDERRTISRELHDEVGQSLTALRMQLGALERLRDDTEQFAAYLDDAKALAEQTLRTVRDIAVGLRPSVLDLGLGPALQWQARYFSRTSGMTVAASVEDGLEQLPDMHATCVYRIVQEALTNSARHSQATQVDVRVSARDSELEVVVQDNGSGFKEDWAKQRGLGLVGIEERARELGGSVSIDSAPGRGARIQVSLPVPKLPVPKEAHAEENTRTVGR